MDAALPVETSDIETDQTCYNHKVQTAHEVQTGIKLVGIRWNIIWSFGPER